MEREGEIDGRGSLRDFREKPGIFFMLGMLSLISSFKFIHKIYPTPGQRDFFSPKSMSFINRFWGVVKAD